MTDIQRYAVDGYGNVHKTSRRDEYAWLVSYYDHVEALRAAEQRGYERAHRLDPDVKQAQYRLGVRDATDRLWRYFKDKCGPITGKGMTAGPVCVDEAVAAVEGTKP